MPMDVWIAIGTDSGSDQTTIIGVYSSQSQASWACEQKENNRHGPAYWEKWEVS